MNPSKDYQTFIHKMKYARITPEGKRETWDDSVSRLHDFLRTRSLPLSVQRKLETDVIPMIRRKAVVPSMRLLASAGPACERENLTAFNCMFLGIDSIDAFGRMMYALMCGTGVGFSVEQRYIKQLPVMPHDLRDKHQTIQILDNRLSWATGTVEYIKSLWRGEIPWVDYSAIRPKGSPLVTTGGYASGPEPLQELHEFILQKFINAVLYFEDSFAASIDIYDICCKIADVVVQGGVRRSACICLFDHTDDAMMNAKSPQHLVDNPWRYNSNNSAVFDTPEQLLPKLPELLKLAREAAEPGIVMKCALKEKLKDCGRDEWEDLGVNPCGEIILRSNQVCNLTEVVLKPGLSLEDNMEQVEAAVILGLIQSQLLDFSMPLMSTLKENTKAEGLLGVSLTGLMDDSEILMGPHGLDWLREYAHRCAEEWSRELRIPCPRAITCVKPSGTVSKLVDSSAGVHPRFSEFYLSNINVPRGTPMCDFLMDQKVPIRTQDAHNVVFAFPLSSPPGARTADTLSAVEQLDIWNLVNTNWCDHNASCTIYVGEDEWDTVEAWVTANISSICGVTFMSRFTSIPGGAYMPLEKLTKEAYDTRVKQFPAVNWELYNQFDTLEDLTSQEFACTGGQCELTL